MLSLTLTPLVLALVLGGSNLGAMQEPTSLGTLPVGEYTAHVLFHDPADDGKSYRVTVAISKPWDKPGIRGDRIDTWLLANGGKALKVVQELKGELLIEVGSAGATANAITFFERLVGPNDLAAVVVSVDGVPVAFKLPGAR